VGKVLLLSFFVLLHEMVSVCEGFFMLIDSILEETDFMSDVLDYFLFYCQHTL
jgi:hypothetical protein